MKRTGLITTNVKSQQTIEMRNEQLAEMTTGQTTQNIGVL
jgi:hypothetical protein